jgi:methionyl-tRNA synthetase
MLISNPDFIQPSERYNEVVSKLKEGVQDLSISRTTLKWGIPFPNDPEHVVYVWLDALSNYISALNYGTDHDDRFQKLWPADVHLIGKEILWFHAVYWPCILLSLGEPFPRKIFAHGWWLSGGRKMSKTEGNFIGMEKLRGEISNYGLDSLRYYLLRASCFGNDLNWVDAELARSFSELSNTVGNCLQRTLKMVARYRNSILPAREADSLLTPADRALINQTQALLPALSTAYEELQLQRCALLPVELARAINVYIETTAPFQLAKDPAKARRLDTVLNLTTQGVYTALAGLLPILPHKAQEGLNQLQVPAGTVSWRNLSLPLPDGHALSEGKPLFQRA